MLVVGHQRLGRRTQPFTPVRLLIILAAHDIGDTGEEALDDGQDALPIGEETRLRLYHSLKAVERVHVIATGVGDLLLVIDDVHQVCR